MVSPQARGIFKPLNRSPLIMGCLFSLLFMTIGISCHSDNPHPSLFIPAEDNIYDSSGFRAYLNQLNLREKTLIYSGSAEFTAKTWKTHSYKPDQSLLKYLNNLADFTLLRNHIDLPHTLPVKISIRLLSPQFYSGNMHFTIDSTVFLGNNFLDLSQNQQTALIKHEVAHILLRYSPVLRKRLYDKFHFAPLDSIILPPLLQESFRHNPDLHAPFYYGQIGEKFYTSICTLESKDCNTFNTCSNCNFYNLEAQETLFVISDNLSVQETEMIKTRFKSYNLSEYHPEEIFAEYIRITYF